MIRIVTLLIWITLLPGLAVAQGKIGQAPEPDHSAAPACEAAPLAGESLICQCPAGTSDSSVWGTNPYTGDSDICTAARHSGVIGAAGGPLQLVQRPGQNAYAGSTQNGVTTQGWGPYNNSFEVLAAGGVTAPEAMTGSACPVIMDAGKTTLTCGCRAGDASGSVWGSGPYTDDSSICAAAVHSGTVGPAGGDVTVLRIGGLDAYSGTTANGVTTGDYGQFGASIVFDRN